MKHLFSSLSSSLRTLSASSVITPTSSSHFTTSSTLFFLSDSSFMSPFHCTLSFSSDSHTFCSFGVLKIPREKLHSIWRTRLWVGVDIPVSVFVDEPG
uniref:Uncharacterized protein n=1 Tax=Salix viminalis TaxID=40686 RepID=A0A6N2MDR3_SALVM